MTKRVAWDSRVALIGLGSLLIYVLACTSFSPDDSKVLYPTVDANSGRPAVGVYDRKTGKSEILFQPIIQNLDELDFARICLLRPQWLDEGHSFLATWQSGTENQDTSLNLAVVPYDRPRATRTFQFSRLGEDGEAAFYYWPLPVVGSTAFLKGESNNVIRVNLETGELRRQESQKDLILLPSPDNDRLFYVSGVDGTNTPTEFGLLNVETFARTPLVQIKGDKVNMMSFALSRDAKTFAYGVENEYPPVIHLVEAGWPARTLSLASLGENAAVNVAQFSPKGDVIYGSFKQSTQKTNVAYGFVEIPVDGSPIRKTILINDAEKEGGEDKSMFASFQVNISHDGKTLAVESLWLAYDEHVLKADDCALFLVDLGDPLRKVTKVLIPLPRKDKGTH
jgi:hypothetical protein